MTQTPIYEERQSSVLFYAVVFGLILAFGVIGVYMGARIGISRPGDVARILVAFVLSLFVLWGFSRQTVTVTRTELRFGFPIWRKRIPISEVQVGEVVRIPFWYGIGIHFIGRAWVYNARLGRGLRITVGRKRYIIGSHNPERLQSALLQVAKREDNA